MKKESEYSVALAKALTPELKWRIARCACNLGKSMEETIIDFLRQGASTDVLAMKGACTLAETILAGSGEK